MYNLTTTILELPRLVGCRDFPDDQQGMQFVKLIQDFINDEYKFDGQTVRQAFKMAVKRELFMDGKRIDPSTFGQHLSVNVVGQILTAYKESVRDGKARPQGYNYKQLPEAPVKKITPNEAHDMIVKWCREDGKLPMAAPYHIAYRYLIEKGLVKEVSNVSQGRTKQMFGSKVEVSAKRQAAENWYLRNCF